MPINNDSLDNAVRAADLAAGNAPLSDADLSAQLNGDLRTVRSIALADLVPWLSQAGIPARLTRTLASTTFTAAVTAAALPMPATADQIASAVAYFSSPHNNLLDTGTDAVIAASTYNLLRLMVGVNGADATLGVTPAEMGAFLAFGGGVAFGPGSTAAQDVTDSRARLANQAARLKVITALASVLNDWLPQQATSPNAAAVNSQVGTALTAAGVQ